MVTLRAAGAKASEVPKVVRYRRPSEPAASASVPATGRAQLMARMGRKKKGGGER